jgi:hypothetical protein
MTDDINRYALMMEAYAELRTEMDTARHIKPIPARSTLEKVLTDFGPIPDEALFLGVASDDLPVLLNLHDPLPGPLLIIGDPGTGKTAFLQTIAHAAGEMHPAEKLQFGALTSHPDEWSGLEGIPNNVGVFSTHHKSSEDFILSLASWAHGNKSSRQSVLLLLDDLEATFSMNLDAVQNLRWLLLRGPARRVWPIITLSTGRLEKMEAWLGLFRTRILGKVQNTNHARMLEAEQANLETLRTGFEFALREGSHWLRFLIPAWTHNRR